MNTIFKTWKPNTYFEGMFRLRDRTSINWATAIDFPTVFTAYGKGIKSGGWRSCTAINTPQYVITNYFDTIGRGTNDEMKKLWDLCFKLCNISWNDFDSDETYYTNLIAQANVELMKLKILK